MFFVFKSSFVLCINVLNLLKDELEDFILPKLVTKYTGQTTCPFGIGVINTTDTCIGHEICEELWNPER